MKNNVLLAEIDQNQINYLYCKQLFEKFLSTMSKSPYRIKPSCPFGFVYTFFGYLKIDKQTAREIIRFWISARWCERAKYYGLKLNGVEK